TERVKRFRNVSETVIETPPDTDTDTDTDTEQTDTDTDSQAGNPGESERIVVTPSQENSPKKITSGGYTPAFETFWSQYPKQEGKWEAFKEWKQLKPSAELQNTILSAVVQQKQSYAWREVRYIPQPAKWLSGKRWEDEIQPWPEPP